MKELRFREHRLSGSRLTIPITPLGNLGPRHYAIVLGTNEDDGELWVAELSLQYDYRLVSLARWKFDNRPCLVGLRVEPNDGKRSNFEVAQSAAEEVNQLLSQGDDRCYNLIFNNCETFADRHTHDRDGLSRQVQTAFGLAITARTPAPILPMAAAAFADRRRWRPRLR